MYRQGLTRLIIIIYDSAFLAENNFAFDQKSD